MNSNNEVELGALGCSFIGFPIVITWTFFLVTIGSWWNAQTFRTAHVTEVQARLLSPISLWTTIIASPRTFWINNATNVSILNIKFCNNKKEVSTIWLESLPWGVSDPSPPPYRCKRKKNNQKSKGRGKGPRSTTGPCQENKDKYMIKIHLKIFIYKNNRPREYWFILYP